MSPDDRALRTRLRAHGRQLGDRRDRETRAQEIQRLAHEVAYEHWHRMLFARFLAENQLLIDPESGVAISMAECEDLARDCGEDAWVFAGRAAARMLPRIFRPDDPSLEVGLAPESRQALERLLSELPAAVFIADDALGWTYQFWQAERKDEVNKSGVEIGADELPAVTQLFTEHYMVQFLFHNTIGAWRAGKILAERPDLAEGPASEEDLREAVRLEPLGGYGFSYLRFVREPHEGHEEGQSLGSWRPGAGAFEGWPRQAAQLRVLDPCCGSGHFLVEGLHLLTRLRIDEEGLALDDALRAVIGENLFGLEIDPRCTQIAAFNVALAAWKMAGTPIELPALQIACSGLSIGSGKREWLELARDNARIRNGMERLYDLFDKAPELGSLIDPRSLTRDPSTQDMYVAEFADLEPLLAAALAGERRDEERLERAVAAQGMARAADLLAGTYTLVITNVPYLGRSKQSSILKAFAEQHHTDAKADLSTILVSRIFRWLGGVGTQAVVTPQNWLFLTSYKKLRRRLLSKRTLNAIVLLGSNAFRGMNWWAATTSMMIWSSPQGPRDARFLAFDVGADKNRDSKSNYLSGKVSQSPAMHDGFGGREMLGPLNLPQFEPLENPDSMLSLARSTGLPHFSAVAMAYQGLSTGDNPASVIAFWETPSISDSWAPLQMAAEVAADFSGRENLVRRDVVSSNPLATVRGRDAWCRDGVAISQTGRLIPTRYTGEYFSNIIPVVVPHDPTDLPAVWSFAKSGKLEEALRGLNRKLSVDNGYFGKVEFDLIHWQRVAAEQYPNGLPEPQSNDPTQWLFDGHPARAEQRVALQVAVARLTGYRWPPERDAEMLLAAEAREWVTRCRDLVTFPDKDGIVCLASLRGESGAADRLRALLAAAFGSAWSVAKERELLAAAAEGDTPSASLEDWLREHFFEQHCKLFHHAPFVWHIWDGRKDGFHALVNYHRLAGPNGEGRRTLEALTYSYLGDWILRQQAEQREGREGADGRVAAALDLQAQLVRILAGEPPCDIFVRWKALHQQPIGWEPDLDDGVRLNIRPFLSAELRTGGRKGAGILRWKPNVKWSKDRGQDPQSLRPKDDFPWFWSAAGDGAIAVRTDFMGGASYDGNRWNDLHYTNATKQAARDRVRSRGAA